MVFRKNDVGRDGLLYGETSMTGERPPLSSPANGIYGTRRPSGQKFLTVFGRRIGLPRNRWLRMVIGVLLLIGGLLGFLPILGVWMIPLGFLVLSIDLPSVRRWRRRSEVWGTRRYRGWKARRGGKNVR